MPLRSTSRSCATGILVALSAACAHTRVTPFDPTFRPPRRTPASDIRFYGASTPKCPYDEIGRISSEGGAFVSWDRVVEAARKAAYELGGDAVIGVHDSTRISGVSISPAGVSTDEKASLSGIVIRFRHLDCME